MSRVRIGTRGSALALWQANAVARALASQGAVTEIITIRTTGDRLQSSTAPSGSKAVFVNEIEDALVNRDIDIAVHSAKDLPADLASGLTIAAVLPREDPRDVMVLRGGVSGAPARIATSSVRRIAQLSRLYPGASFEPIRGNVDTRLRKLDAGEADALALAAAGLIRLGLASRIFLALAIDQCMPAPGQGIVAVEVRDDDPATRSLVMAMDDALTHAAYVAERSLVAALGGGCQLPLGAIARPDSDQLRMEAVVISPDGATRIHRAGVAALDGGEALGRQLADDLLAAGARSLLDAVG